ncbi:MAG: MFS transporter [Caldilineaceae bacterium]|nr:MFS transporter [Caldilineaceae bacterium]
MQSSAPAPAAPTTLSPTPSPARAIWLLTAAGFFSFFIFGFIDNLKGSTLSSLLVDLDFSYAQGGSILFGAYLGFFISTLAAGFLADSVGNQKILILAGGLIAVGVLAFAGAGSFWLLFGTMLIIGLGMGCIEVSGNGLIVELHRVNRGRYLNLLATFHGIGSLVVPLYAGWLLNAGVSWRQVFQYTIPLALLLVLAFALTPRPQKSVPVPSAGTGFDWQAVGKLGFTRQMIWFYLAIAFYVSAELGIGAWIVEFLQRSKGFSLTGATGFLSLFFGMVMAGRVVGSFVVERLGYVRSVLGAATGGLICVLIGIFGPPALAVFVPLCGLFFSIIFPTITAVVSVVNKEKTNTILGLLFAAGGVGGALGPWAIGLASNSLGIQWGFSLVAVYCLLAIAAVAMAQRTFRV